MIQNVETRGRAWLELIRNLVGPLVCTPLTKHMRQRKKTLQLIHTAHDRLDMKTESTVPIYPLDGCQDQALVDEISKLVKFFTNKTGERPEFVAKCPGRVNLIGEHIDYCGYPVFPMAIEKHVLLAVKSSTTSPSLRIFNLQDKLYPDFETEWAGLQVVSPPSWKDYVLCGIKGIDEKINDNNNSPKGLTFAISGNIPPAAGLSSSSAIVCSSAVSTWYSLNSHETMVKETFASNCAKFERMIGTAGGGMDQAIQFLAQQGSAGYVQFQPRLSYTPINLPKGAKFYISHSGASCNKGTTSHFNTRVLETRLAAAILAVHNNIALSSFDGEVTLSKVQDSLKASFSEMINQVEKFICKKSYSLQDTLDALKSDNLSETLKLISSSNHARLVSLVDESMVYKIQQRAQHVFTEASRVESFKNTCLATDLTDQDKLTQLGQLMNESHTSCRDLYECSCDQLDELVRVSRECGAIGARLTGAGWGGCMIALVKASQSTEYEANMRKHFPQDDFTFNTQPSGGITIFTLSNA